MMTVFSKEVIVEAPDDVGDGSDIGQCVLDEFVTKEASHKTLIPRIQTLQKFTLYTLTAKCNHHTKF
jgi:hypothetical protein